MDKTKVKKRFFHPSVITLLLVIVMILGNSTDFLYAQQPGTPTEPAQADLTEEQVNVRCEAEMTTFTNEKMAEYRQWMEQHFQNKSSTTSLLTDGMARYKQLRTTLYNELYFYAPQQNALLLTEGVEGTACRKIVEKALAEAKRAIDSRARSTSAVKKSTVLLTKYQELNDKMAKLTRDYLQMKAYLDTFAAKLPCYINRSCNKG